MTRRKQILSHFSLKLFSNATALSYLAESQEEAEDLCKQEPLVAEGYATYILAALQVADKDNDYLMV